MSSIMVASAATAIKPPKKGSIAISTRVELEAIKDNLKGNYHLTKSIDLSDREWVPIDDFRGTLDGQGYCITNLYTTGNSGTSGVTSSSGLFETIYSADVTIKNLGVNIGSQGVHGLNYAGGLIGDIEIPNRKGTLTIENCYVTGDVFSGSIAGGLIGSYGGDESKKGRTVLNIKNCFTTGNISAKYTHSNPSGACDAGGLIGSCSGNSGSIRITNCYTTGDVTANKAAVGSGISCAGGLVGFVTFDQRVSLTNCYTTGDVSRFGGDPNNGYVGELGGYDFVVNYKNCFYLTTQTVTGAMVDGYTWIDGEGKISKKALTPEEMRAETSLVGWNFKSIWGYESGKNDGYPVLLAFQSFSDIPAPSTPLASAVSTAPSISSTAPSSWAESPVNQAIKAKLVPQSLQSNYTQPITRAEFCALAVALYEKVMGRQISSRKKFDDTSDTNVEKAGAIELVTGTDKNNFSPSLPLTREQAAALLSRLALALKKPLKKQTIAFTDKDSISSWSIEAVGQVQAAGIMSGTGNNKFSPKAPFTREQSIVAIMRLYDIVK